LVNIQFFVAEHAVVVGTTGAAGASRPSADEDGDENEDEDEDGAKGN